MSPDHLFAGLRVREFAAARMWYERLLGEPTFVPHATEAVWTLAECRLSAARCFGATRRNRAGARPGPP